MSKNFSKGFTLVELAIVLVVIGILLGGVLKGQELISNAKYKRLKKQIDEYAAAVYTYYDRYQFYPGDDPQANSRWSGAGIGNGDGHIAGGYCTSATEESCLLWNHLRYAGIIGGDPTDTNPATLVPRHVYGGQIDIFSYTLGGYYAQIWVALRNVPGEVAERLDREIDDGNPTTGIARCYSGCSGSSYPQNNRVAIWFKY